MHTHAHTHKPMNGAFLLQILFRFIDVNEEEKLSCAEAGGRDSSIHPAAVVHPNAILGQVLSFFFLLPLIDGLQRSSLW